PGSWTRLPWGRGGPSALAGALAAPLHRFPASSAALGCLVERRGGGAPWTSGREVGREGTDRREAEEIGQGDVRERELRHPPVETHDEERVAPQVEEVVFHADALEPERL